MLNIPPHVLQSVNTSQVVIILTVSFIQTWSRPPSSSWLWWYVLM